MTQWAFRAPNQRTVQTEDGIIHIPRKMDWVIIPPGVGDLSGQKVRICATLQLSFHLLPGPEGTIVVEQPALWHLTELSDLCVIEPQGQGSKWILMSIGAKRMNLLLVAAGLPERGIA